MGELDDRAARHLGATYENAFAVPVVEARDISNAVVFLVSDESRFATGLESKVDAGVTIRQSGRAAGVTTFRSG